MPSRNRLKTSPRRTALERAIDRCRIESLETRVLLASQAYSWQNAPIGGGGFVTGIIFSPTVPNLVYARTDVGGAYRWDQGTGRWTALTDWAGGDPAGIGVETMAIDPNNSNRVYATLGLYTAWWAGNASFISSTDRGQTWTQVSLPFKMGGNEDGRSNGERLMVDPNSSNILFLATPDNGVWRSTNYGASWSQLAGFPVTTTADGAGVNFIQFIKSSGTAGSATPTIYAGVSQTTNNLYKSTDGGTTWQNVSNPSLDPTQMPERSALDGNGNMYITFGNAPGPNGISNGSVWKLAISTNTWTNITPSTTGQGGFAGVSVDAQHPATVVVTTMDRWWPRGDTYRSTNGGTTWTSLRGTDKPYPNNLTDTSIWDGTDDGLGWAGDIEIDPFNSNHALIIHGGGIASTFDLSSADTGAPTHWNYFVNGLEETVQITLVSPPSGASLLTAAGDVAGERFADLTSPASNYSVMGGSNRDIDFAESNPNLVVRSGDNSPNIAYSRDNGVTWTGFPSLPANTGTGSGSVDSAGMLAMSADGNTVVWDPGDDSNNNLKFPLSYSTWNGSTWSAWTTSTWSGSADVSPVSDRLNANDFYVLDGNKLYLSSNKGASWTLQNSSAPSGTLQASFAASGDLWINAGGNGLWHSTNFGSTWTRVASSTVTNASSLGLGKAATGQSYPALYIMGTVSGTAGIFRSDDAGATWTTISDSQHQYNGTIAADRNVYGRVYIGADARGIIYGDIQSTAPSVATAAAATPVTGNTTNLSVLGADDGGESNLTYTWRVTNKPPGANVPTFSVNGSNAAKNTTATFTSSGYYSFQVAITDAQGHIMISSVGLTVAVSVGTFTSDLDIGSPSPSGSASYNATTGTYTVAGGGSDIWNTSDQFHFTSNSFTGDGVIIARVTSVQNTDTWAKGAVMFRDTTAANAMFADVLVSSSSGISFQWRNSTGGNCGYVAVSGQSPAWVKLVRSGSTFTAFYATTTGAPAASDWIQLGTPQTIAMGNSIQAGLAVTSHSNGNLCSATFTGVQVNQNPTVATAAAGTPNPLTGASTALSVLGADDAGESNLTYTWTTTGTPPAPVSFSANGTNTAKNTTATFTATGTYNFLVAITDAGGLSITSPVTVTVIPPAWLGSGSVAAWNPSAKTLTVTGATSIVADPGTDEPIIQASSSAAQITVNPASGNPIHVGGISLTNGAGLTVTSVGAARSSTNYRVLVLGVSGTTTTPTFTIDSTSKLDLADNDMAVLYGSGSTPFSTIRSDIAQAYDSAKWDKPGLTSSIAQSNPANYALGYAEASTLGLSTFDNIALGGHAVLVKYTLLGDAYLAGTVDLSDYTRVILNLGKTAANWTDGNFDYSGNVNLGDYTTVVQHLGQSATSTSVGSGAVPKAAVLRAAVPKHARRIHHRGSGNIGPRNQ